MKSLHHVDSFLDGCAHSMRLLANWLLVAIIVLVTVNIGLRTFRSQELVFVLPWAGVLFVWVSFFGFFVIFRMGRDITIDFLVDNLGRAGAVASRVLSNVIVALVTGSILSQARQIVELQAESLEMIGVRRYWLSLPLFLSCALIIADVLVDLVRLLSGRERRPVLRD